jgi:hypothetical protein
MAWSAAIGPRRSEGSHVLVEHWQQGRGQRHRSPTGLRLRGTEGHAVRGLYEHLNHGHRPVQEVEVASGESYEFAPSTTGESCREDEGPVSRLDAPARSPGLEEGMHGGDAGVGGFGREGNDRLSSWRLTEAACAPGACARMPRAGWWRGRAPVGGR